MQHNDGSTYRVQLYWELAWRRSFPWSPSNPVVGTGPIGGNSYCLSGAGGWNGGCATIAMTCVSVAAAEDWFVATYPVDIYYPYYANPVTVDHGSCCRLSILEEGNADNSWRIYTVVDVTKGTNSPRSTNVPRLYASAGTLLQFIIPSSAFNGFTNQFQLAPVGDSSLTQARPCGMNACGCGCQGCRNSNNNAGYYFYRLPYLTSTQDRLPSTDPQYGPYSFCSCTGCVPTPLTSFCANCLTISPTGFVSWTPANAGLYAVQFKIQSYDSQGVAKNAAPLDFIISVLPACATCPRITLTAPDGSNFLVYVGLETRFNVVATMTGGVSGFRVSISYTPLPTGATISPECLEGVTTPGLVCTVTVRWTPTLGQLGSFVCFQGTGQDFGSGPGRPGPNINSFGQLCVTMPLGVASIIYLSGIVRDFKPDHPDFARTSPQYARPFPNFVQNQVDANGKALFNSGVGATLVTQFSQWYNDVAGVNLNRVYSITLTNATQTDPNLYSYRSTAFYPINCQLWDSSINNCDPSVNFNSYFTYMINTYTTYNPGQQFTFRSSDDMWLFINGNLVPGWNLGGVHNELSYTVIMDNLGLTAGQTYRADLFFAHRGLASQPNTPSLQVQFPQAALCNALSFPQTVINIANNGFTASNVAMTGVARVSGGTLQPVQNTNVGPTGGTAWYSVGGVPQLIKLGNGFSTTFTFSGTNTPTPTAQIPPNSCEGFAFVIQNAAPTAFGGDAGNLNYAPIAKSLAVEFDAFQQVYLSDPSFNHISVHSLYDQQNSADESVATGAQLGINVYDPALILGICNGTVQTVTIQYLPGQINDNAAPGTPAYGWLRVFMNANLVPTTQAQIDSVKFNARIGTAAYVGFTSAVSGPPVAVTATINIFSWSMVVVPTSPQQCDMAQQPISIVAGTTGTARIQARDACNNKIRIGGEAANIALSLTPSFGSGPAVTTSLVDNNDGTYTVSYTPFVATAYTLRVTWAGSLVQPDVSNPFPFSVQSAATSHLTSQLLYSLVLPASRISNAPTSGAGTSAGVQMLVVDHTNTRTISRALYDLTDATERAAFLTAFDAAVNGNIVAISFLNPGAVLTGTTNPMNWFSTATCNCGWTGVDIRARLASIGSALGGQACLASIYGGAQCVQTAQWAIVGVKGGAAIEQFHPRFAQAERCQTTTLAPFISFCVRASSGSSLAIGGIQSSVLTLVRPVINILASTTFTNFTIQARDLYNNTITSASDQFKISFSPALSNDSFWGDTSGGVWKATYDQTKTDYGFYNFAFFARRSGTYQMFVNLLPGDASTPIQGSPFTVIVRSGPASGVTTTALGTGLSQAQAGVPATFQLNLMDAGGNPVIGLQGDVITGFVTYLGVNSPITGAGAWSGTGPMTLSYNVTRSTDLGTFYTMSISINGGPLVAVQNAQISVSPGPVAGSRCTTNLQTGVVITAGQPSSYLIQSRDWFGNARLTPLDQFSFTFSVNPNDILSPSVTYLGLGVYQATFTATTAILHTISTFYNGVLIGGSPNPASLTFVPGPAARQSAVVAGSQLPLTATCNSNTVFCITASSGSTTGGFDFNALDQYSNPRPAGADLSNFAPQCRNAQGLVCTQLPALTLVSNNRYQMRWGSRTVGNYSVGVTVSATGEQITGTPMFVVVNPDVSVPTQTTASGPGIAGGVEGTQTSFVVQARDQFGNLQLGTVTNQFQFRVNGGAATACVKNGATSTYTCTYTLPFPAPDISYTLRVEMFYLGSFQTALNYLPFSAASTSVFYAKPEPLPLAAIRTGVTATFIVRDQQSNGVSINTGCNCISVTVERNATGDISDYTFSGPTYITSTMGVAGDNSKYTIALNIVPTSPLATAVAGRYLVRVFKNAVQTVSSPYFLTILPGAFDLAQSTVPSTVTGVAGARTSFTVIMRDAWGQLITQNATYLPVLTIAATPQVVVNGVWDAANSWYTFSYNLTTAATVTGSLVMVSGGPTVTTISIVTGPAPVSARDCTAEGLYPDAINNNGLTKATVSIPQTFYVKAFDSFGNAVPGTGLNFVVTSVDTIANPVYTPPTASSPATNLYTGTWVPVTAAASATMGITLGGIHIRGSPFPLVVQPGAVSGSLSFITSIPATVPAGSTATWVLVTKDVNNNAWQSGNTAAITATVVTPRGATILAVVTARNPTTNPGEYDLSLPSTLIDPQSPFNYPYTAYVGTFQVQAVQVSVGASTTTIGTGVGSFSVVPGTPAAEKTSFVTAPFINLPIETNHVVTFQLADTYGNTLTNGGGAVVRPAVQSGFAPTCAFSASGEASGSPQRDGALNPGGVFTYPATATDNGDGTYSFTLSSVGQGFFYVNATVNGRPIDCLTASKQALQVSAGVASGNMSYAVGPALVPGATSAAGDLLLFDVFVQDRLGNLRKADGRDTIAVGVTCPGAPAPDCLPASFPVASYGINADRSRWLSAASAAKATVVVTYDNPNTYNAGGAPAGWGDAYHVSVYTNRSATYQLVIIVNGQLVSGTGPSGTLSYKTVTVVAGPPASWDRIYNVYATAAYPASFPLTTVDRFGNVLATPTGFSYSAVFKSLDSIDYLFYGTPVPNFATNKVDINFIAAWPGYYQVNVVLQSSAPGFVGPSDRPAFFLNVSSATCGASNSSFPLRCPIDRTCVADYTQCNDIQPRSVLTACSVRCWDGSCVNAPLTAADCPCQPGLTKCPSGHCANTTVNPCLVPADCPTDAPFKCQVNGAFSGQCRATAADCPAPRVCPPGLTMCSDTVTCVTSLTDCPAPANCPAGYGTCPDNTCARAIEDCPTPKSCPATRPVVCPDGSCQSSYLQCPDMYTCFAPTAVRCADGSCRADSASCPSSVTCPAGTVLCENGQCAESVAQCGAALQCSRSQVRCPDGSCVQNLLFCPSRTTCPPATPVLCPDGSCSLSSFLCPALSVCPTGTSACPDGSCAADVRNCPTPVSCPAEFPVLCSDGSCQTSVSKCVPTATCPPGTATRCPDGSCRASLLDCPSNSVCPSDRPVRCFDGACAVAIGLCASPANYTCAANQVRCPGGECASAVTLCPTHVTCLAGFVRCLDGSCRTDCTSVNSGAAKPCGNNQVLCPQANAGNLCSSSLQNCPQGIVCPASAPVKCVDASCAASSAECPPPPSKYEDNFLLCPDGTWASGGSDSCARPPTCPPNAPYKCYDLTCRMAPADCPVPPRCPLNTPYLCPNGNCVGSLWLCKPYGQCDTSAFAGSSYVQCADPGHACKTDVSQCPPILSPTSTSTDTCPYLWTACKDGSCKEQANQCVDFSCPSYLPVTCPTGLCVLNATFCPLPNACPYNQPVRCWSGVCRESNARCFTEFGPAPATQCPGSSVVCPDGSCAVYFEACPNANGCNAGEIRCLDGRCASYSPGSPLNPCLAGADTTNACPGNRPFRCADGFCALSSTVCPSPALDPTLVCSSDAPMLCANGQCVKAAIQCPLLYPCPIGQERCQDGSCRAVSTCPCNNCDAGNTCPINPNTGARLVRCANGLCAPDFGSCPSEVTGCPGGRTKCPNGACILGTDSSLCANFTRPSNGCPSATPYKCNDGSCATSVAGCKLPNGCLPATPYLCFADGSCKATPNCNGVLSCEAQDKVRCADGTCATSAAGCNAANGCPISAPIRCANGQCGSYPAGSGLPNACPLVTACANPADTLCYTGSCVASPSFCPPLPSCSAGQVVCSDFSCRNTAQECPTGNTCPASSPVQCPSGFCKKTVAECGTSTTISTVIGGVCAAPNVVCFDGSCRASNLECMQWAANARVTGSNTPPTVSQSITGVCPGSTALCSDGSCMPTKYDCPIVAACPRFSRPLRCWDGSCANSTAACPPLPSPDTCVDQYQRCEDGSCRPTGTCLPFDGCGLAVPFQCLDRRCMARAEDCPISVAQYQAVYGTQSSVHESGPYRTQSMAAYAGQVLAVSAADFNVSTQPAVPTDPSILEPEFVAFGEDFRLGLYWPCNTSCRADIKAERILSTVAVSAATTIPVAYQDGSVISQVLVPSGSLLRRIDNTTYNALSNILIRPVSESRMKRFTNYNAAGRGLGFQYTVVSPAFECLVDSDVVQPFVVNLTYVSNIDSAPQLWGSTLGQLPDGRKDPLTEYLQNVCLASPTYQPLIDTYVWKCLVFGTTERAAKPVRPDGSNAAPSVVQQTFGSCGQNGTVYAFIFSPPYIPVQPSKLATFIDENIHWILLIGVGTIFFVCMFFYAGTRLYRYRGKLHKERKEVKSLEAEVDDMEQFGGRVRKDSDVQMVDNPMSVQLKEMQARYDANELKLRQAEAEERAALSAERAEAIKKMEEDRNMMSLELEKLKKTLEEQEALALQSKQKAMESAAASEQVQQSAEVQAQTKANAAVVRSEFTVAKPKRRQLSRAIDD